MCLIRFMQSVVLLNYSNLQYKVIATKSIKFSGVYVDGQERWYTCCKTRLSPAGRGDAGRVQAESGVLCLPYPLLGSVRSVCVFKTLPQTSENRSICPGNNRPHWDKCAGTTRPSVGRHLLKNYLIHVEFRLLVSVARFLIRAARCGMFISRMRRAGTVRTILERLHLRTQQPQIKVCFIPTKHQCCIKCRRPQNSHDRKASLWAVLNNVIIVLFNTE